MTGVWSSCPTDSRLSMSTCGMIDVMCARSPAASSEAGWEQKQPHLLLSDRESADERQVCAESRGLQHKGNNYNLYPGIVWNGTCAPTWYVFSCTGNVVERYKRVSDDVCCHYSGHASVSFSRQQTSTHHSAQTSSHHAQTHHEGCACHLAFFFIASVYSSRP
jgi:hypothetical protein